MKWNKVKDGVKRGQQLCVVATNKNVGKSFFINSIEKIKKMEV